MGNGNLDKSITAEYKGDFIEIKNPLNNMSVSLSDAFEEEIPLLFSQQQITLIGTMVLFPPVKLAVTEMRAEHTSKQIHSYHILATANLL